MIIRILIAINVFAFLSHSVACGKKGFRTKGGGDGQKLAVSCQESAEVRFQWDWCGPNIVAGSDVTEACSGRVFYTDMIFSAIKVKTTQYPGGKCLFANGNWQDGTPNASCERVILRDFAYVVGPTSPFVITECLNGSNLDRVSGALAEPRSEFVSQRP
ncbi:MAG: hypothetical protein H6624_07980 [Bdellovibrionaceae bacterium]|nr:hypothetical protein [Bdellovibrionales bacterium]MCB9084270.1 hypothetical protein [Pseudobdellovibrionaceae bacterium]